VTAAGGLFTTAAMSAAFSPRAHVAQMLRFEAALARAAARAGLVPGDAADAIAKCCRAELYDVDAIYAQAATAGTPVVPLVRMLTERVPDPASGWVHWGATSQDVIDTALVLQMREGIALLRDELGGLCANAAVLAERHRRTLMTGRTLLQQALPITFGLKAARWLALAARQRASLETLQADALTLQFGGASGTLASLGDRGGDVASHLAEELELPLPDLPWHAERDRVANIAATLGVTAGAMQKIAGDIVLLAQTEVGEVAEAAETGKGVSSAMPHKRNPVDAIAAIAAARLALTIAPALMSGMAQEHERGVGAWQAEWAAIPELFGYAAGAVARVRQALDGLEVDVARMRTNLDAAGGTSMAEALASALAVHVGRAEAHGVVQALSARVAREGGTLREAALADARVSAVLPPEQVVHATDPANYLGSADAFIDRALAAYRRVTSAP
jgi:3-carboxy-cis,cis-muconate cycloisomerase